MTTRAWFRQLRRNDFDSDAEQLFAVQAFIDLGYWPWMATYEYLTLDWDWWSLPMIEAFERWRYLRAQRHERMKPYRSTLA